MSPSGRREALAAALVGAVAFLPFLRGVVSGASLYFRDLALYFLPLRRLALEGLGAGEVRLWNPFLHEGVPLSLPALGYPGDLLQLLRPDEAGISLVLALHVPLAAVGFHVLARRLLGAPAAAAAGGALVYALGGFVLSTVNLYVYVEAAAWSPFVVLALARVLQNGSRRTVAAAALVVAVALSTTGVEIVAQAVVVGVVLGLWRREGAATSALARLAGAVVLGALIAAPVLVLVASQVGASARGQGFETGVVLAHSVHPFTLVQGLVAGLYGNLSNLANEWWGQNFFPRGFPYILSLYIGPAALGVALVGARGRHPLRTPLLLLAALGLVLCLGRWSGLAPLVDALPGLRVLRYPVKAFFTVHLAVALLVSLGLTHCSGTESRRGWTRLAVATASLGALLALAPLLPRLIPGTLTAFAAAFFPPGLERGVHEMLLSRVLGDAALGGTVALAVAAVAGLARAGRLRHATLLVVALLGGDLLRAGSGLNPMVTADFFQPSSELAASLGAYREGRVFSCRFDESPRYRAARQARGASHEAWTFAVALETLTPAFNVRLRVPSAMSPDLTMLVPPERVLPQDDPGCRDLNRLLPRLRRAGVGTILSADPLQHPDLRLLGQTHPRRLTPLAIHAYGLARPLERLRLATNVVAASTAAGAATQAARPGFLEAGGAAVEGAAARHGVRGRVESQKGGSDWRDVTVDAGSPTVLVVRDGWAPGWIADVNGVRTPVARANGRHQAVAVPAGRSTVALRYRPRGLAPSVAGSLLGLAVLVALAWRRTRTRPRLGASGGPVASVLIAAGLLAAPATAHAALDPETGSYGFQVLATVIVGAGFGLRAFWPRLRARLAGRRPEPPPDPMSSDRRSAPSRAVTRALALLLPPILVLASAHELYLRNQQELARTLSVLHPFWTVAAAAVLLAAALTRVADHRAGRLALTGYYAAGLGFMCWSFLRALPFGAHLLRWLLDSGIGAAAFAAAGVALTILVARRVDPRDIEPFFATLAVILVAREAMVLGAGLDRRPPPPPRDIVAELDPGGDPALPNVYHLILDSFPDELFEARLGLDGAEELGGFVRFRATSRAYATSQALPAILAGRWLEGSAAERARRGLAGEESLLAVLRGAGYRTLAFVPRYIYESQPSSVDVMVFHRLNVPEPDARALHAAAFLRLWLFRALPLAASERLARGEMLGFGAEFFEMKGVERVATFHKPLLSRLSLEGLMAMEPRLSARGRYTLVHLALPHAPFRLRSDCSDGSSATDLAQQTDCSLLLLRRFVALLHRLDRFDDATILVHGDHGSGLVMRDGRLVEDESAWYRTLLLVKTAGARGVLRLSEEPAVLEDITPTLLDLLEIEADFAYEGRALEDTRPRAGTENPGESEAGLTATGLVGRMPNTRGP